MSFALREPASVYTCSGLLLSYTILSRGGYGCVCATRQLTEETVPGKAAASPSSDPHRPRRCDVRNHRRHHLLLLQSASRFGGGVATSDVLPCASAQPRARLERIRMDGAHQESSARASRPCAAPSRAHSFRGETRVAVLKQSACGTPPFSSWEISCEIPL
jgi:hypothetical protein